MDDALDTRMGEFVTEIGLALGLALEVEVERIEDGTRVRLAGDGAEALLQRRAAGLDALQHVVNAAFRREHAGGHVVVDCLDYRKGKDEELRESARILAQRVLDTGSGPGARSRSIPTRGASCISPSPASRASRRRAPGTPS